MIYFPSAQSQASSGLLPRASISSQIGLPDTFITSGYTTANDGGQGAMYTKASDGTGAMAIQDGSGQWYKLVLQARNDIRWFGAKMDSAIDDTTVFQDAIDSMPTATLPGAATSIPELVIPAGTLWIRPGQISVPVEKQFTLRGAGMGGTFIRCRSGAYSGDLMTVASPKFTISDISFQGTWLATSGGESDGLAINGAYASIRDVGFYYFRGNGLSIGKSAKSSGNKISNVQMRYIFGRGLYVSNAFQNYDSIISNCDIGITGKAGIYEQCGANNYYFNHPWGCGIETDVSTTRADCAGIALMGGTNILVGNQSETNRGDGIYVNSSRNNITAGYYWGNRLNGVALDGANTNSVKNNTIQRNGVDNSDGTSELPNYAAVLLRGNSFGNSVNDNELSDQVVTLSAGSYQGGYTPTYGYPGRTPAKRTQNYGVYYEAISGALPYQNSVKNNDMRKENHTTASYGCNTFGSAATVGKVFSVDCQWEGNHYGTQDIPVYASASSINVQSGMDAVSITGTTTINTINTYAGIPFTMIFASAGCQVTNGTSIKLAGGANYTSIANGTLTLRKVGTVLYEVGRSA